MPGGEYQQALLNAFDDGKSLYELSLLLPRIGMQLLEDKTLKNANFKVGKTALALMKDAGQKWEMFILLHSMNRDVIRSIILGTIAYDSHPDGGGGLESYKNPGFSDHEAQGIYVIGLRRDGKGGKFVNEDELRLLIRGISRYLQGADIVRNVPLAAYSTDEAELVSWVAKVDAACRSPSAQTAPPQSTRFINNDAEKQNVLCLVRGLVKRRLASPSGSISAAPAEVRQVQSPLYVGCSTNLPNRIGNYSPSQHLTKVNKPMALTVSVMEALGLPVSMTIRVVLRTWKGHQLPIAEQLVATLAGSLVCQTGFNAIQAGGRTPKKSSDGLPAAEDLVLAHTDYLYDNLQETEHEAEQRFAFQLELAELEARLAGLEQVVGVAEEEVMAAQPAFAIPAEQALEIVTEYSRTLDLAIQEAMEEEKLAESVWALAKLWRPEFASHIEQQMAKEDCEIQRQIE